MPTTTRRMAPLALLAASSLAFLGQGPALADTAPPDFSLASIRSGTAKVIDVEVNRGQTGRRVGELAYTATSRDLGIRMLERRGVRAVANLSLLGTDSPAAAAVGHEDGVTVSWDVEPGVVHYLVTRNGDHLAEVDTGVFVDNLAPIGELLTYRIDPVTDDDSFAVSHGVDVVRPAIDAEIEAMTDMVQLSASRFQSIVTWKSFIRQQFLDSPGTLVCDYSTAYKFGGDYRGFTNGYPYRTMIQAVINWNNGGSMSYQKGVGPTKVYRKSDNALVATRTASSSKLTAQRLAQSTSTRVELYLTKHATNPFCTKVPNAIEGYVRIAVTRAGAYSVLTGRHLQMPAHEIYVGDQGTKQVYTRQEYGAVCLQKIACPAAYITGSGTYT